MNFFHVPTNQPLSANKKSNNLTFKTLLATMALATAVTTGQLWAMERGTPDEEENAGKEKCIDKQESLNEQLRQAAKELDAEKLNLLIEQKADINAVGHDGDTALLATIKQNSCPTDHSPTAEKFREWVNRQKNTIKTLLESKANTEITDKSGSTALRIAIYYETLDNYRAKMLLEHKADIEAVRNSETLLMTAAGMGLYGGVAIRTYVLTESSILY